MSDAVDKVDEQQDEVSPHHQQRQRQVEQDKKAKANTIVEKWYEENMGKLTLCKKKASGSVYREYIGSIHDKDSGKAVKEFIDNLKKTGMASHQGEVIKIKHGSSSRAFGG